MAEDKFFYANGAEMAVTPYDITFKFLRNGAINNKIGELAATTGGTIESTPTVMDAMSVSMSPSHAKAMTAGVIKLIADYEKQFGEIPLSPEANEKWRSAFHNSKA